MITVFIPDGQSCSYEHKMRINGQEKIVSCSPRVHRGRTVVDVPRLFFVQNLLGGAQGLSWQAANPEIMEWLGAHPGVEEVGDAFPGKDRPAPPVAVVPAAPIMVKLRAPADVSSFSHAGEERQVGKDGTVTVLEDVASVLRSHGFRDAA